MPRDEGARVGFRRRLAEDPVDSRWWYWIAAVPATFGLWAIAVGWVAVAVAAGPFVGESPLLRAAEISLIAFGVPALALIAVFPFAVYADAGEIVSADVDWRPRRIVFALSAAVGPLVTATVGLVDVVEDAMLDLPGGAIAVGFLLCVPVAGYYLYRRHERLGVP